MSLDLGIKKDLVAKAGIPIDLPQVIDKPTQYFKTHKFPIAILESVEYNPSQEMVDRQTQEKSYAPVLNFIYKDTVNPEKKITDKYFPIDTDDDKFETKLDGLQKSIKHVFEEIVGADKFDEADFAGKSFAELFENVAKAFNKFVVSKTVKRTGEIAEGEADTEVIKVKAYTLVPVYLKLIVFNNRAQTPMFPNYVQKAYAKKDNATVQTVCELSIGAKESIVNKADAKPAAQGGARDNGFGGGMAFGMDAGAAGDMVFPE